MMFKGDGGHLPKLQSQVIAEIISSTRWIQTRIKPEIKKTLKCIHTFFPVHNIENIYNLQLLFLKANNMDNDEGDGQPVGTGSLLARPLALLPRLRLFISAEAFLLCSHQQVFDHKLFMD